MPNNNEMKPAQTEAVEDICEILKHFDETVRAKILRACAILSDCEGALK